MAESGRGFFISLEGGEGSGKTTQARRLASWLAEQGRPVLLLREPGSTEAGEELRTVLFARRPPEEALQPVAETLLFHAARAQLVGQRVAPALAAGAVVITDRFADSTVAYQGYGLGMDVDRIERVNAWATGGLAPDLTLLFDFDPTLRAARRESTTPTDPFEARNLAFHRRVRRGYLVLADRWPQRIAVIDAQLPEDEVFAAVRAVVANRLSRFGGTPEEGGASG